MRADVAWQEAVKAGHRRSCDSDISFEAVQTARRVALFCGIGRTLDVGSRDGLLVEEMLKLGIDAAGVDLSAERVAFANARQPGRFIEGSPLDLPFDDCSFDSVVSLGCLEHQAAEQVVPALQEVRRVSRRNVYLQVETRLDGNEGAPIQKDRAWWEQRCLDAGLRKHPAYYLLNDYEALNDDPDQIRILLEKIPDSALDAYPLAALAEERDLHMDMTREVGERSDAHMVRYRWAAQYLRPGDRVLDAACGLGYGSYQLATLSEVESVTGVDGSDYAAAYAGRMFGALDGKLRFLQGMLPGCLKGMPDESFDAIISFETLEHVEDPEGLLREFQRLLTPGGRVFVSVPNDWSDETGEDPNPWHLHVYTFDKLRAQLASSFLPEEAYQQIASGCKIREAGNRWQPLPRTLRPVSLEDPRLPDSEWWLMVGMKDPLSGTAATYRETVYAYSSPPAHLLAFARDYHNPWLVRAMVEFPFRARSHKMLASLADRVLDDLPFDTPDAAAALAVLGYQLLERQQADAHEIGAFCQRIATWRSQPIRSPHMLRWSISLCYLSAQLYKRTGDLAAALGLLQQVADAPVEEFSPSLGTKVIDAAYEAGSIAAGQGDQPMARRFWLRGVERAWQLLASPLDEFLGDRDHPQEFPSIVAVEMLDSAVRCIKALRWTSGRYERIPNAVYFASYQNWKAMLADRASSIAAMEQVVTERGAITAAQDAVLADRWRIMEAQGALLAERDEALAAQAHMLEERWTIMKNQGETLEQRWSIMQEMGDRIAQCEQELRQRDAEIARRLNTRWRWAVRKLKGLFQRPSTGA